VAITRDVQVFDASTGDDGAESSDAVVITRYGKARRRRWFRCVPHLS
jgi:hypothetical protein